MPCIISYKGYRYITSLLKLVYVRTTKKNLVVQTSRFFMIYLNDSEYNIPITFI